MKDWYQKTEGEILSQLQTTREGLDSQQAEHLLQTHGENILQEGKKESIFEVFIKQFCDLLVIILIAAAVISMFSGNVESTSLCRPPAQRLSGTEQKSRLIPKSLFQGIFYCLKPEIWL